MPRITCLLPLASITALGISVLPALATDYQLYYLGGQSNMDGYGYVKELPADLKSPVDGVMIFHGNPDKDGAEVDGRGQWSVLQPGHGVGFNSDGKTNRYSDRFGLELSFARELKKLHPGQPVAIIKYSRGGTSIAIEAAKGFGCWDPDFKDGNGVNQWDHFLATMRNALAVRDIDGDGQEDKLVPRGILWMQGESDAHHAESSAKNYEENLRRLMDLIRATLRTDDVPVVIGRISNSADAEKKPPEPHQPLSWQWADAVRKAQADYVEADGHAALVTSTDTYGYSDPWHYDSEGFLDLGKQFALALQKVE